MPSILKSHQRKGSGRIEEKESSQESSISIRAKNVNKTAPLSVPTIEKEGKVYREGKDELNKEKDNNADIIEAIEGKNQLNHLNQKESLTSTNWLFWWNKPRTSKTGISDLGTSLPTKDLDASADQKFSSERSKRKGNGAENDDSSEGSSSKGGSFIHSISWSRNTSRPNSAKESKSHTGNFHMRRMSSRRSIFLYLSRSGSTTTSVYEMLKDCRYYLQHPYLRIGTCLGVMFLNFLIYFLDPMAYSKTDAGLFVIGNDVNFLFYRYPPHFSMTKVAMLICGIISGVMTGYFCHTFLFNRIWRLQIFSEGSGRSMIAFVCVTFTLYGFSEIYNLILKHYGVQSEFLINSVVVVKSDFMTQINSILTWFGDFITFYMVLDVILQEKLYPSLFKKLRKWWNKKYNRIYLFYTTLVIASIAVIFLFTIANKSHFFTPEQSIAVINNELSRAILASFILMIDLAIFMQDWDFPHFCSAQTIKLPGANVKYLVIKFPILQHEFYLTGKYFNYAVLSFVMVLDMLIWISLMTYVPLNYGQYTHPETQFLYSATDEFSLRNTHNTTLFSYEFRIHNINPSTNKYYIETDIGPLNARFVGFPYYVTYLGTIIPVVLTVLTFFVMFAKYGRYPLPTPENPYVGRLKSISTKNTFSRRFSLFHHNFSVQNKTAEDEELDQLKLMAANYYQKQTLGSMESEESVDESNKSKNKDIISRTHSTSITADQSIFNTDDLRLDVTPVERAGLSNNGSNTSIPSFNNWIFGKSL